MEEVKRRAQDFDILHFHNDLVHFPLLDRLGAPSVTTPHGRLDLPDLAPFYRVFARHALVSISNAQRAPLPFVRWTATVLHGLPPDLLPFRPSAAPDGPLAFLGRISPEKRPDRAIAIAARAGRRLRIAAKIDNADFAYWRDEIEPMIRADPRVEFLGEISEAEKADFLGEAAVLLFPIDWPEPFGMVMIEAMSCGTPVVAWPCGAAPEVVDPGVSGFLVDSLDAAVDAVEAAAALDRGRVRACFDRRFRIGRVAADYLAVYHSLSDASRLDSRPLSASGKR
jgi:glycosyltransferase involved in cell wall biosynthesis